VWGSFAVSALLMAIEVWQAQRQRADTLRSLRRERDLVARDHARATPASTKEPS
jgi:heme exporter protein CcmD